MHCKTTSCILSAMFQSKIVYQGKTSRIYSTFSKLRTCSSYTIGITKIYKVVVEVFKKKEKQE